MSPDRKESSLENGPRQNTRDLIHLLEMMPVQNGMSITDAVMTMGNEPEHSSQDFLQEANTVEVFTDQREQQRDNRNKNSFKISFMNRYQKIMRNAKVTESCKEFLFLSVDNLYDIGVKHDNQVDMDGYEDFQLHGLPEVFIYITQDYVEHEKSGGIFDENSSQVLEMRIYNRALSFYELLTMYRDMAHSVFLDNAENEQLEELGVSSDKKESADRAFMHLLPLTSEVWNIPVKGETTKEVFAYYESLLDIWRMQIEQRYGIIPHREFSNEPEFFASDEQRNEILDGETNR